MDRFVEKPDHDTAARYIEEGQYFWNSGMFLFRADTFLQELKMRHPEILEHVKNAVLNARMDLDFFRLEEDSYAKCENISIDYAVMEKATNVRMVVLDGKLERYRLLVFIVGYRQPGSQRQCNPWRCLVEQCNQLLRSRREQNGCCCRRR